MSPGARFAVVGAGSAGLSAARMLQDRGAQVVVFERGAEPGGRCLTQRVEGREYELGALWVISSYGRVLGMLRHVGLPETQIKLAGTYVTDGGTRLVDVAPAMSAFTWRQTTTEGVRLLRAVRRLRRGTAAFNGLAPGLGTSFAHWCEDEGIAWCAQLLQPWFTGFGYGYYADMPAAYALRYFSFFRPVFSDVLHGGFQELWRRVARGLDVRTNTPVLRVERGNRVRVHTARTTEDFDGLIVACPPDQALAFLDATQDETALFSRVRYHRYLCTLVDVGGSPLSRWGFFTDNLSPQRSGHPMFWYRRWPEPAGLVAFYTLLDAGRDPRNVDDAIDAALRPLQRGVRRVVLRYLWDRHCPHASPADFAAGWYDQVEALQGQRQTFYTGEALTVGTTECAVRMSEHVVRRFKLGAARGVA